MSIAKRPEPEPLEKFIEKPRDPRPHSVQVRLSEAESHAIAELAKRIGVSRSELIRALFRRERARLDAEKANG